MADPWFAIVRPIWATVVQTVSAAWTSDFCDQLHRADLLRRCPDLVMLLKNDIIPIRRELALVIISQGGEASFSRFLECLKVCHTSRALGTLAKELDERWEKPAAGLELSVRAIPWRGELFKQHRSFIESVFTSSAGDLRDVLASGLGSVSLLNEEQQRRVKGKGTDRRRDGLLLDIVGKSETSIGYLFALLRIVRPNEIKHIEGRAAGSQPRRTSKPTPSAPVSIASSPKSLRKTVSLPATPTSGDRLVEPIESSSGLQLSLSLSTSSSATPKITFIRPSSPTNTGSTPTRKSQRTKFWSKNKDFSESMKRSYKRALVGGRRVVPHIRLLLCGPGRAGKTSLRRSMLNQKFSRSLDSTLGIELQKIVCTARRLRRRKMWQWQAEKDEYEQHRLLTKKVLTDEVEEQPLQFQAESSTLVDAWTDEQFALPSDEAFVHQSTVVADCTSLAMTGRMPPENELELAEDALSSLGLSAGNTSASSLPAECTVHQLGKVPSSSASSRFPRTGSYSPVAASPSGLLSATRDKLAQHIFNHLDDLRTKMAAHVQAFINELTERSSGALTAEDEVCFVDLWDFAGQYSFATVQHMLLAEVRCAYAVVFNASLLLMDPAQNTFCRDGIENVIKGAPLITNLDVIESWLNTIHQAIGDEDAPVYVIGCQIDRIPAERREDVKEAIKEAIWLRSTGKGYRKIIDDILFVDNTLSGTNHLDPSVGFLREEIVDKMCKQVQKEPIPLCWLPFTVAVRWLAKERDVPWLSMQEAHQVVKEVCPSSPRDEIDVAAMLQFHHHLGHVLHYASHPQLRDYVVIDVSWIVKVISVLFQPHVSCQQEKHFRDHYDKLYEKGVMLESLAEHIWQKEGGRTAKYTALPEYRNFLFRLMEHFSLLFDTKEDELVPNFEPSRKFYVPALVGKVEDGLVSEDIKQSPPLYLCTGPKVLCPQALFWCLVVRCMTDFHSTKEPVLLHNSARLLYKGVFWLVLTFFEHGIRLIVEHEHRLASLSAAARVDVQDNDLVAETCHQLLHFIEHQIDELKSDTFNFKHISLQRSAHCNCPLNSRPCARHRTSNCKQLDCHHFVDLVEGEEPRCPLEYQLGQPDANDVAMCWLFPPSVHTAADQGNDARLSTSPPLALCVEHTTAAGPTNTAVLSQNPSLVLEGPPSTSQPRSRPDGVRFHDMKKKDCAEIFQAIARKFANRRAMIVSLLLGLDGNKKLLTSRLGVYQSGTCTEQDLLFEGLSMWFDEEDSSSCTGRVLFDALVEADCTVAAFQALKELLGLPANYTKIDKYCL